MVNSVCVYSSLIAEPIAEDNSDAIERKPNCLAGQHVTHVPVSYVLFDPGAMHRPHVSPGETY